MSSGTLRDLPTYLERLLKADPESNPLLPIQVTGVEDRFVQFDVGMDFGAPKSLLDPIGLEQEFEEALGRKVDLLTPASLSPTCGIR